MTAWPSTRAKQVLAALLRIGWICVGHLLDPERRFMSDRSFVDTKILIYAHDTAAGAKHERGEDPGGGAVARTFWSGEHAGTSRAHPRLNCR
jgi:hypothetical protein